MALLVNLARQTDQLDLGAHGDVVLTFDELRDHRGAVLAHHRHNRWIDEKTGDEYSRLEIAGPLQVCLPAERARVLGPYETFSMFDGVGYVDQRVFAFTDLQQKDWYVHDVGEHWPALRLVFHRTGP